MNRRGNKLLVLVLSGILLSMTIPHMEKELPQVEAKDIQDVTNENGTYLIRELADLEAVLTNMGQLEKVNVRLETDIAATATLVIGSGSGAAVTNLSLELNGHTISSALTDAPLIQVNNAQLDISGNGSILANGAGSDAIQLADGHLTMSGGTVISQQANGVNVISGSLYVSGGTVQSNAAQQAGDQPAAVRIIEGSAVLEGGTYASPNAACICYYQDAPLQYDMLGELFGKGYVLKDNTINENGTVIVKETSVIQGWLVCFLTDNPSEKISPVAVGADGTVYAAELPKAADILSGEDSLGEKKVFQNWLDETTKISSLSDLQSYREHGGTLQAEYKSVYILEAQEPTMEKEKVYDGTTEVKGFQMGNIMGLMDNCPNVTVEAKADYDTADAGENKTITVAYSLSGTDADKYEAPKTETYTGGKITKAEGCADFTQKSWIIGQKQPKAAVKSETNGTDHITYFYKKQGAADSTYTSEAPTAEGAYTAKAEFAETTNYQKVTKTADFTISYLTTPQEPYTLKGEEGSDQWYTGAVTIMPKSGYLLSEEENGTFSDSLTVEETKNVTIYLQKKEDNAKTAAIKIGKIQIDGTAPEIIGAKTGETYRVEKLKVTIKDEHLASVNLNGKKIPFSGKTAELTLKPSPKDYVIAAKDEAGNLTKVTVTVGKPEKDKKNDSGDTDNQKKKDSNTNSNNTGNSAETENADETAKSPTKISGSGKLRLKSGEAYQLESGRWKVQGDATIYEGGNTFYVTSDGEYQFE